jgi:hypothetical protein
MDRRWKTSILKIGFWVASEVWLNYTGLDRAANTLEFIYGRDLELSQKNARTVEFSDRPPDFCQIINEVCPASDIIYSNLKAPKLNESKHSQVFAEKCYKTETPCIKILCLDRSPLMPLLE